MHIRTLHMRMIHIVSIICAAMVLMYTPVAYADDTQYIRPGTMTDMILNSNLHIITPFVTAFTTAVDAIAREGFSALSSPVTTIIGYMFACSVMMYSAMLFMGMIGTQEYSKVIVIRCAIMFTASTMLGVHGTALYWKVFYDTPIAITANISSTLMKIGYSGTTACDAANLQGSLSCISANIESTLQYPLKLAFVVIAHAASNVSITAPLNSINDMITGLLGGMLMVGIYLGLMCYIAISLSDIAIQIGMLSALAPIFIASTLSNYTRTYAKRAVEKLFGTLVHIIGISIATGIMNAILAGHIANMDGSFNTSVPKAITLAQNGQAISIFSPIYILTMIIGIFYISVVSRIVHLLEEICSVEHGEIIHNHLLSGLRNQRNGAMQWAKMRVLSKVGQRVLPDEEAQASETPQKPMGIRNRMDAYMKSAPFLRKNRPNRTPYINPFRTKK